MIELELTPLPRSRQMNGEGNMSENFRISCELGVNNQRGTYNPTPLSKHWMSRTTPTNATFVGQGIRSIQSLSQLESMVLSLR